MQLEPLSPEVYDCILSDLAEPLADFLALLGELTTATDYDQLESAAMQVVGVAQRSAANLAYVKGQARLLERLALGKITVGQPDPRINAVLQHIERCLAALQPTLLAPMPIDPTGQWGFAQAFGEQKALTELAHFLMGLEQSRHGGD